MLCLFTLKSHKTVPPFQILVASCGFEDDPQWVQLRYKSAAAAAKSLQSCPTLCDPIDSSPLGSPVPGILQARILEWVAISFSSAWKWKVKVKVLSRGRLFVIPWTAAYQAPVHGIFQAITMDWLPFPPPGDGPNPEIKPMFPVAPALQVNS